MQLAFELMAGKTYNSCPFHESYELLAEDGHRDTDWISGYNVVRITAAVGGGYNKDRLPVVSGRGYDDAPGVYISYAKDAALLVVVSAELIIRATQKLSIEKNPGR